MSKLSDSGPSGSGSSGGGIDASSFIDSDQSIKYFKLFRAITGSFVLLWTAIWLEVFETFVGIHVWMIDSIGRFLEAVVLETMGGAAAAQTEAWRQAFISLSSTPLAVPFIFAAEAFVLYAAFAWLRDKEVVP